MCNQIQVHIKHWGDQCSTYEVFNVHLLHEMKSGTVNSNAEKQKLIILKSRLKARVGFGPLPSFFMVLPIRANRFSEEIRSI